MRAMWGGWLTGSGYLAWGVHMGSSQWTPTQSQSSIFNSHIVLALPCLPCSLTASGVSTVGTGVWKQSVSLSHCLTLIWSCPFHPWYELDVTPKSDNNASVMRCCGTVCGTLLLSQTHPCRLSSDLHTHAVPCIMHALFLFVWLVFWFSRQGFPV